MIDPIYRSIEELQKAADEWLAQYHTERTHSGKYCYGKNADTNFPEFKTLGRCQDIGYTVRCEYVTTGWLHPVG